MAILTKGHTFADGDQVTSTKLNNLVDAATFAAGAVDTTTIQIDGSGYLKVGTIQSGNIAAGAVGTAALADSSSSTTGVTTAKLATGAVTTAKIADSTGASDGVTTAKLATGAVTTAKITDSNVTTAKIADANVTAAKLSGAQTGSAPVYGVRAWVVFDMTRNAAGASDVLNTTRYIISSGNVTSVTKTNTGKATVAFTTALPDANYGYFTSGTGTSGADDIVVYRNYGGTKSTSSFQIEMGDTAGTNKDFPEVTLMILG